MKPNKARYLIAGVLLFALQILVSCSGDNGTSRPANNQDLTLSISGTFTPTEWYVSPHQVRVWLDDRSLSVEGCGDIFCDTLDVNVTTRAIRGQHILQLELVAQACDLGLCGGAQKYKVVGNVTVSNSSGVIQEIPLDKQTVSLAEGDKVSWQIDIK
jgi:hypothetical protein